MGYRKLISSRNCGTSKLWCRPSALNSLTSQVEHIRMLKSDGGSTPSRFIHALTLSSRYSQPYPDVVRSPRARAYLYLGPCYAIGPARGPCVGLSGEVRRQPRVWSLTLLRTISDGTWPASAPRLQSPYKPAARPSSSCSSLCKFYLHSTVRRVQY
jgi:hypothetical protein